MQCVLILFCQKRINFPSIIVATKLILISQSSKEYEQHRDICQLPSLNPKKGNAPQGTNDSSSEEIDEKVDSPDSGSSYKENEDESEPVSDEESQSFSPSKGDVKFDKKRKILTRHQQKQQAVRPKKAKPDPIQQDPEVSRARGEG